LASPKVAIKETTEVLDVMSNSDLARPGSMVRSMPIMPPTNMLVSTSRAIWRQLSDRLRVICFSV